MAKRLAEISERIHNGERVPVDDIFWETVCDMVDETLYLEGESFVAASSMIISAIDVALSHMIER